METPAIPLTGGRVAKDIVRIGDTVHRLSATSAFTEKVLNLLEEQGFEGAPRYLGQDEAGRDMLTFIDGWVPPKFQRWTNDQVAAAGALLRALHDATRGSDLAAQHEVVCHHDAGPNNVVFRDGQPAAFIDFDTAAPGSPLEDLGYMAWLWCVSSKAGAPPVEVQAAQVRTLLDAYRATELQRSAIVDAMLERQARNARYWTEAQTTFDATAGQFAERIAWSRREHAFTAANREVFSG